MRSTASTLSADRRMLVSLFAAVVLTAAFVPSAGGQDLSYVGSLQYASGNYVFAEQTRILYFSNGLTLETGRIRAAVSVPFIVQSTLWVSYGGAGALPTGGPQHDASTGGGGMDMMGPGGHRSRWADSSTFARAGVGDPLLTTQVRVLQNRSGTLSAALAASVKLPLADVNHGFGTGAWDAGAGLSVSTTLRRTFLFLDAAYWHLGDLPGLELLDSVSYGLAVGRPIRDGTIGLTAWMSGYTEIIRDVDPPIVTGAGASYRIDDRGALNAAVTFGLTESTPDVSLSIGWRVAL